MTEGAALDLPAGRGSHSLKGGLESEDRRSRSLFEEKSILDFSFVSTVLAQYYQPLTVPVSCNREWEDVVRLMTSSFLLVAIAAQKQVHC